jgi:hypothetical protein
VSGVHAANIDNRQLAAFTSAAACVDKLTFVGGIYDCGCGWMA